MVPHKQISYPLGKMEKNELLGQKKVQTTLGSYLTCSDNEKGAYNSMF